MMSPQLTYTLGLIGTVAALALIYGARVIRHGKPRYARVEKQGGSSLLSRDLMDAAYWFFQPLGRLLVLCRVTPNQISWVSLLLGLVAGVCLVFGHFGSAAAFAALSAVLDALDGLVARETGLASDAGEVLDATVDRYVEFFFLGGLAIYYREIPALLALSLLALVGSFMVSYSTAKAEALRIDPPKGNMRRPERAVYLTLGAALSPVTIPIFEQVRDTPVPVGHPMVLALSLVAVMSNASALERLWFIARAIRLRERAAKQKALEAAEHSSPVEGLKKP